MNPFRPGAILRFDVPCEALGMTRPPTAVALKFLRGQPAALGPDGWTVILFSSPGMTKALASWMRSMVAGTSTVAPGIAPRSLRYQVDRLPPAWTKWLLAATVLQIDVAGHGTATLFVQGTPVELAALAGAVATSPASGHQRVSRAQSPEPGTLTARQLQVLCTAVALGYYEVPHRIDLRELGAAMGLSVSAVSQLLRRAQGEVIRAYVDASILDGGDQATAHEAAAAKPAQHEQETGDP